MLQAVIFDMDGLLIDSEPFWRQAEKTVLAKVGIELTEDMCRQTTGLRLDDAIRHWYDYRPWREPSVQAVETDVLDLASALVAAHAQAMAGVNYILEFFRSGNLRIALASSSPLRFIDAVVDKLGIRGYFEVMRSGEHEEYGKPHPAIYLTTAAKLGVAPVNCLAFEDSFPGLLAAKAARMRAVVVPEPAARDDARLAIADLKLKSLPEFGKRQLNELR